MKRFDRYPPAARRAVGLFLAVGVTLLPGCDRTQATVRGSVSLDGQPVSGGTILFIPVDQGSSSSVSGLIEGGNYAIPVNTSFQAGKYKVVIKSPKNSADAAGPPQNGPPGPNSKWASDKMEEAIPAQYNSNTTLERELKAGGNTLDFQLSSK